MAPAWLKGRWQSALWNWGPFILWAAAIYWMSSQPVVPHPGRRVGIADEITDYGAHILSFGLLAVLAWRVARAQAASLRGLGAAAAPWVAGLFAALYAVTDEMHQHLVPGRTASARDWLADAVGILLACLFLAWYQGRRRRGRLVPARRPWARQ